MGYRSEKGCWTCKGEWAMTTPEMGSQLTPVAARKIGCDKSLPACNNCIRTGRHCQGYGVKLKWATPDTIRSHSFSSQHVLGVETPINPRRKRIHFLHTSARDVALSYSGVVRPVNSSTQLLSPARPISSSRFNGPATDPLLFFYCTALAVLVCVMLHR